MHTRVCRLAPIKYGAVKAETKTTRFVYNTFTAKRPGLEPGRSQVRSDRRAEPHAPCLPGVALWSGVVCADLHAIDM